MAEQANNNISMGWDDTIEYDGQEFILLPEGDYNFTVANFERGTFNGTPKVAPGNMAILTLQVDSELGTASIKTNLILNRTFEWKISAFFRSIGQKKHGERLVMNWSKVVGSRGRAHFKPRSYIGSDGTERQANDLTRFYDYDEKYFGGGNDWMNVPDNTDPYGLPF